MLSVISTVTIMSTGLHLFQYFTIKININKGQSYSINVIPIILSMFEAKLLKNLTSIGLLATFVSNKSHKLGNFLNVTVISTVTIISTGLQNF